jgi:type II secretory pathway component PulM
MMRLDLSVRDRRALTLGAAAAAVLLAFNFVAKPSVTAYRELRSAVQEERALLTREMELLESVPALAEGMDAGGDRLLSAVTRMFAGNTDGLASAYLAEYIQDSARASRTLISRLDPAGAEPVGPGLEALSAVVQGESDLEGLLTLLYRLEGGEKLVQISELNIRASRTNRVAPADMEVISFEMKVTGFQLIPFAPSTAPGSPMGGES